MKEQEKTKTENGRCSCTDDYGCGHGTARCNEKLTDADRIQMSEQKMNPKCVRCWPKDIEHHGKSIQPSSTSLLTAEQKRAVAIKSPKI